MTDIDFFLPGPVWVREDVRQAMTGPAMGHRSAAFKDLYSTLEPRLRPILRTEAEVMIATGSATLIMESAVVSTVAERLLNVTCGAFSERWHTISLALGKQADKLEMPWGEAVDPDLLRQALRRRDYEAVTVVHNETSTGVINPLSDLSRVVQEESEALLLVDTVSSLGGAPVETEEWQLDLVLASTQKALAAPPGLTVFTMSSRAAARAVEVDHRGFYTDLLRYRDKHRSGGTITTPAIPIVLALDRQLDVILEEGVEARWERHAALRAMTAKWAAERGFEFAAAAPARSPTISCLRPPPEVAAPDLVAALAGAGYTVGAGYGPWKPTTFRIGHMGEVRGRDLEGLLTAIDRVVSA